MNKFYEDSAHMLNETAGFNNFKLYETVDNGVLIPRNDCLVLVIVDRAAIGAETISKLNLGRQIQNIFIPNSIKLYNKAFNFNKNAYDPNILNRNNLHIINNLSKSNDNSSLMIDITPYISFLYNKFNINQYSNEAIKFISNTVESCNKAMNSKLQNCILIHVIDNYYINDTNNINNEKNLYAYMYLDSLVYNNYGNRLGNYIDDIFVYNINNKGHYTSKIYDKGAAIVKENVIKAFKTIFPNIYTAYEATSKDNTSHINVKKEDITQSASNDKKSIDDNSKFSKEETSAFNNFLKLAQKDYDFKEINTSTQQQPIIQNSIINKIEESQYVEYREIPILDKNSQSLINNNSNIMFPFLNATKNKNDNITDINHRNLKEDLDSKLREVLSNNLSTIAKNKEQEKKLYDIAYNSSIRNPNLIDKAIKEFNSKEFVSFLTYIHNDNVLNNSKIYPEKKPVDRDVLNELDRYSSDKGNDIANSFDNILNKDIINDIVYSNIHRVSAQKQLTWDRMPQEIERFIGPVLNDNGFELIKVTMVDKEPSIRQIEPTYLTEIRINIRNKKTRRGQTLLFNVQTLKEGKYHVSGGIRWYFPNVIATLPIFIRKPGNYCQTL